MKKLYPSNHKFYEQYYVDQAKQKSGNLPASHEARFQRGYGLGSIFKGLFRWAMPHLQQGAKVIGKKALQTGVNVAQDILDGDNLNTAIRKQAKQAIGNMTSQRSQQAQSGEGQKGTKRKAQGSTISSTPGKKAKASPQQTKPKTIFDNE